MYFTLIGILLFIKSKIKKRSTHTYTQNTLTHTIKKKREGKKAEIDIIVTAAHFPIKCDLRFDLLQSDSYLLVYNYIFEIMRRSDGLSQKQC